MRKKIDEKWSLNSFEPDSWKIRRRKIANQPCRNSVRGVFRFEFLHCQKFWRQVEWPSIQTVCTFITAAAFQVQHKRLFDAICFFKYETAETRCIESLGETWMSWRQPATWRYSFVFFLFIQYPFHSCYWSPRSRWTLDFYATNLPCSGLWYKIQPPLKLYTYIIFGYGWFIVKSLCILTCQEFKNFNVLYEKRNWWAST